jgi:hypothetical protein
MMGVTVKVHDRWSGYLADIVFVSVPRIGEHVDFIIQGQKTYTVVDVVHSGQPVNYGSDPWVTLVVEQYSASN